MKVILELTGLEYRIIHEAVGALLDDAKKEQSKIDRKENPTYYEQSNFRVQKIAALYSSF